MSDAPLRTKLHQRHVDAGGRMVNFAGWEMPVQYTGILDEHKAVRVAAGIFDISHMGEFFVSGPGACAWLDRMLTNNASRLAIGESQYTLMLNERGGVIDDLIVYRYGEEEFLMVVNAAKIAEDAAWLTAHAGAGASFEDRSADYAALAIQGPKSAEIFERIFARPMPAERNRVLVLPTPHGNAFAVTTGYTGEDGFEWVLPAEDAPEAWDAAVKAGAKPCGLGARDTLRLEMCYPLNGSDLSPDRTPLEAGLGFFVDLSKPDFLGKAALEKQKAEGLGVRLTAIAVEEKSPPIRSHYPVVADGAAVTETTSGALSPSLGCGIALAYLPAALAKPGQPLEIEVRGRRFRACVRKKPLYQRV
jgi:aminomethyltransferase